jgi:hypothetical protein
VILRHERKRVLVKNAKPRRMVSQGALALHFRHPATQSLRHFFANCFFRFSITGTGDGSVPLRTAR